MEGKCPYYQVDSQQHRSRALRPDYVRRVTVVPIPWCGHPKHSPVSREDARGLGRAGLLTCGGRLEDCPLSEEKYRDQEP